MARVFQFVLCATLALVSLAGVALAQSRNALVIGNSAYESAPRLKTPATDAAIIAETLRAAGYEVTELRDVRQANIGQAMRDFLDKAAAGGSDGAAFFYFSGYGAQAEGENYLVPVDAVISNDGEVAKEAFHLDDLLDELKDIPLAARIVVLDASRDHKFGSAGSRPVAKGLAMGDTIPGMLLAFAAAPGALAIDGDGDYSLFTGALVTMLRQPGLDMEQIFKATRVQVNQTTSGAQTPWMVSALNLDMRLFAATDAAPAPRSRPRGRAHLNQGDAAHALARRGLQGRGRRRHARSLSMVCRAPSELPFGRGDLGHPGDATRGRAVAAHAGAEHHACLLELPQALSGRCTCRRSAGAARRTLGVAHTAGHLCAGAGAVAARLLRRSRRSGGNRAGRLRRAAVRVRRARPAVHPARAAHLRPRSRPP